MRQLPSDPWIAAQIDQVVTPYVGRLPARDVAWLREQIAEMLASDDTAAALLRAARPRYVEESGEVECGGGGSGTESAAKARPAAR